MRDSRLFSGPKEVLLPYYKHITHYTTLNRVVFTIKFEMEDHCRHGQEDGQGKMMAAKFCALQAFGSNGGCDSIGGWEPTLLEPTSSSSTPLTVFIDLCAQLSFDQYNLTNPKPNVQADYKRLGYRILAVLERRHQSERM